MYLTKRAIEPCKGQWHLPDGTVRFGEPMTDAVKRIAERELGDQVTNLANAEYIEYPNHYKAGLDSPVGIVFEVLEYTGVLITNTEASSGSWFDHIPEAMHADQDNFLASHDYLHFK